MQRPVLALRLLLPFVVIALIAPLSAPPVSAQSSNGALRKIKDVAPDYPEQARQSGIAGTVMLRITVATDGQVTDARVIRSVPGLDEAALAAVRQWVYAPTGRRRPLSIRVSVPFSSGTSPAAQTAPVARPTGPAPPTPAALCAPPRPGAVGTRPPAGGATSTPLQKLQAEIQQLTSTIESGRLNEAECLEALHRRGYLYATTGMAWFANRDLDSLIAFNPTDRDAHFFKGLSSFASATRLALPSFTRAIELKTDDVEAYAARGWANLVEQRYGDATTDFGHVLRLAPGDREALRGRAWALIHSGAYDLAIADLDTLLEDSPILPEAVALRGVAHYLAGRETDARPDLRTTMRLRPRPNAPRTYNTVRIDNWRRHTVLSRLLEERAKRNPRDVVGWLAAGAITFRAFDGQGSTANVTMGNLALDRAVALEPSDVDARMMRGTAYFSPSFNFRAEAALADFSEAIRLEPGNAEAYFRRALVYATDKELLASAISDCETALSIVPGNPLLRATRDQLEADRLAWQAERQRTADARAQRVAALERTKEQAAALFLSYLAVKIATDKVRDLTPEEQSARHNEIMNQIAEDLLTR